MSSSAIAQRETPFHGTRKAEYFCIATSPALPASRLVLCCSTSDASAQAAAAALAAAPAAGTSPARKRPAADASACQSAAPSTQLAPQRAQHWGPEHFHPRHLAEAGGQSVQRLCLSWPTSGGTRSPLTKWRRTPSSTCCNRPCPAERCEAVEGELESVLYLAELASLLCARLRRQGCLDLGLALVQACPWVAGVWERQQLFDTC